MSRNRSHAYFEELPAFKLAELPKHARAPSVFWKARREWQETAWRAGATLDIDKVRNDILLLEYRRGDEAISERVRMVFEPLHFGGVRTYLICLRCGGRCTILYIAQATMQCRECLRARGVVHASEGTNASGRALRRFIKLRARIQPGTERDNLMCFPDRPKRMRQTTYARIRADAVDALDHYWGALNARAAPKLARLLDRRADKSR